MVVQGLLRPYRAGFFGWACPRVALRSTLGYLISPRWGFGRVDCSPERARVGMRLDFHVLGWGMVACDGVETRVNQVLPWCASGENAWRQTVTAPWAKRRVTNLADFFRPYFGKNPMRYTVNHSEAPNVQQESVAPAGVSPSGCEVA